MNELRFLEVIGGIDDALIREAECDIPEQAEKPVPKRRLPLIAAIAAAAFLLLALPMLNSHKAKNMLDIPTQPDLNEEPSPENDAPAVSEETTEEATKPQEAETVSTQAAGTASAYTPTDTLMIDTSTGIPSGEQARAEATGGSSDISMPVAGTAAPVAGRPKTTSTASVQTRTSARTTSAPEIAAPEITTSAAAENKGGVDITGCVWSPFRATKDPDTDSYGDDEDHHVDIRTADGLYRQLSPDDYSRQGISGEVKLSDFGGYIGKAVEVASTYEYNGGGAETQEPTLAGADVYRYAPSGDNKAYIIVKKGTQCSLFMSDVISTSQGYRKGLEFFGVQSAGDIQSIECNIRIPDSSGGFVISEQNTITDPARISDIFDLLCGLEPEDYSQLPAHTGSPQWYVDAWDRYRNDPNPPQRTDYEIILNLRDGTQPVGIQFQPYIGNGYIDSMKELTPEQNQTLRDLLS